MKGIDLARVLYACQQRPGGFSRQAMSYRCLSLKSPCTCVAAQPYDQGQDIPTAKVNTDTHTHNKKEKTKHTKTHTHTPMHANASHAHAHTHTHTHEHKHTRAHAHTHTHIHTRAHTHTHPARDSAIHVHTSHLLQYLAQGGTLMRPSRVHHFLISLHCQSPSPKRLLLHVLRHPQSSFWGYPIRSHTL